MLPILETERLILKKGTKASAIVELFTTNGMSGIPGTITLGHIKIEGIDNSKLRYYYVKKGQDRTLWILPLKWALTFIPFAGTFTNLIKGGQAILSPADDITIFYYNPNIHPETEYTRRLEELENFLPDFTKNFENPNITLIKEDYDPEDFE